jgi:putative lysine transport system permease protein
MTHLALAVAAIDRSFWEWVVYIVDRYWLQFVTGAGVTLLISISGTLVGFAIGLLVGIVRTVPKDPRTRLAGRLLRKALDFLLVSYIEIFRGTPMIVQAMVIYYGAAMAFSLYLNPILAGFVIVSINTGAYMAEIVRGGILSIDKGQTEAAHSIGMTHGQAMSHVVLPQAVRNILPALGNEFVINIKDTSVLNVISVTELFFTSKSVAGNNYQYFPVFFITSVVYFVLTFTVTRILRLIERRMEGSSTYTIHGSQTTPESEIRIRGGN